MFTNKCSLDSCSQTTCSLNIYLLGFTNVRFQIPADIETSEVPFRQILNQINLNLGQTYFSSVLSNKTAFFQEIKVVGLPFGYV